jgi:hypothetical protein
LIATVADFTNAPQDAVYRRDRAVIAAFVKQSRVDVRYTAVNKTHLVDRIQERLALVEAQRSRRHAARVLTSLMTSHLTC